MYVKIITKRFIISYEHGKLMLSFETKNKVYTFETTEKRIGLGALFG